MSFIATCVPATRNVPFLAQGVFHILHDLFNERLHLASQVHSEMTDGQEGCGIDMSDDWILALCHFLRTESD